MPSAFSPESIAVIGASSDPNRIAGRPIAFLQKHGYNGTIYPINPNHDVITELTCYPDIQSVPETPDLVMVILPAQFVVDIVEDCVEENIDTVLIVSSGFSETGTEEAANAEQRLAQLDSETDTEIIGPNSQGLINFSNQVTASFTPALKREKLIEGGVSFVTQSGAFGGALTTLLQEEEIGLNKWIATGNEAGRESLDFLSLLATDDSTEIAAGYFEGFEDGRKLIELKRTEAGIGLPIVALKTGRSERGKTAAASHTGKIAGKHAVYESIFRETGVINVDDVDHFRDVIKTLDRLETYPGERVGVITTSGGAGIHIADVAANVRNVTLPDFSDKLRKRLGEHIPPYGSTFNPVDITAQVVNSPESFQKCLRLLSETDEIDTLILQITNASGERASDYAEMIAESTMDQETPLFVVWTGGIHKSEALSVYDAYDIPVFENPARAVKTISSIVQFEASQERLTDAKSLPARLSNGSDETGPEQLHETDAKGLLEEYGVAVPQERVVSSAEEAGNVADDIGYPVAAKLLSPDVHHRDRIGGIQLDLNARDEVESAYEEIDTIGEERAIDLAGVSIQEQVQSGLELGMGIVTDTDFGPVIMLSRGGVDIEAVSDTTFRTIPLGQKQAESMLEELKTVPADEFDQTQVKTIADTLVSLSEIYCDNPWITEADVNPLIVTDDGVTAVDALFIGSS